RRRHDTCHSTGNGSGSDRLPTWSSPWVGSSSHAGRTLLPERSKLCSSHWSNQWLTSNTELGSVLDVLRFLLLLAWSLRRMALLNGPAPPLKQLAWNHTLSRDSIGIARG